jgi:hypothetical protein
MKRLRTYLRWVIDFYRRPELLMGFPIWAPPLIMPPTSPYWRLMMTQDRPTLELAAETVTAPQPARDPIAVARRRAQFRLVTPLREARP